MPILKKIQNLFKKDIKKSEEDLDTHNKVDPNSHQNHFGENSSSTIEDKEQEAVIKDNNQEASDMNNDQESSIEDNDQEVSIKNNDLEASDENNNQEVNKLDEGLKKTKKSFFDKIARSVAGKSKIDEFLLDDIEEALISSDIGVETTLKIISKLEDRVAREKYLNTDELNNFLRDVMSSLMPEDSSVTTDNVPTYVIMVVGVNGVGKTTTIGKLARKFKKEGKKVVLGAADTFRAAAVDQLVLWANKVGLEIIKQDMGSDPASVCYDTLQSAKASKADIVIIDTAGRLHNKINLMNQLSKMKNVMKKVFPEAPHDVMLVLDASTGQNAIEQATQFTKATEVSSIALTKLDGTAKGGVVIGISDQFEIPVRYIGVGEGIDDIQNFCKDTFIKSLFE